MTRFSFSSLHFRLILLVLLAVVPALGLTLYTGLQERQTAANAEERDALQVALLASADKDLLVESTRQLLTGLARLPKVRQADAAARLWRASFPKAEVTMQERWRTLLDEWLAFAGL